MTAVYALGPFRLDVAAGILFRGTEPVALGQRAIALLQILVEGGGNPISKDRLIESAWPGTPFCNTSYLLWTTVTRYLLEWKAMG
jgi:DNA-binding winged helix-turn-helix (wHTH) protein